MTVTLQGVRATIAALVLGVLLAVGHSAPARAAEWSGSFTGAFAANPAPVLGASTSVYFTVSPTLSQAQVRVFDHAGTQLKMCSSGASCSVSSNPAPGASLSYYAELWAYRSGVLTFLSASSSVAVTDPGWTGSITEAYAANPQPGLTESTTVYFRASGDLNQALIRVFDGSGAQLKQCTSGSSCSVSSNPGPGYSVSYYAELWAWRDGVLVQLQVSPTVTVTDPGWTGDFSATYASNPSPVGSASTGVFFTVTPELSAGSIKVYDLAGTYITTCYSGHSCSISSNPAPGTSRGYYAEIWTVRGAESVLYKTSPIVVVTDPGWTGQFTGAEVLAGDEAFMGATSATFTWDQPLQYAWIDIVDGDGEVLGHCTAVGSLECAAGAALGPEETRLVHAEARVHGVGGGHVTVATSATVELTGMDAEALAEFILTAPESALIPLLGTVRADQALKARTALQSPTVCQALGLRFPSNAMFHASEPDATVLCMAGGAVVLAWLIVALGVDLALDLLGDAGDDVPDVEPIPDPDCHHYGFDGRCIDFPDLAPGPDLEASADGARIPPPPNCMSDATRDQLLAESDVESHHIITRYANQAPEGASDVLVERQANVDALQTLAAKYNLGINSSWNKISIPHAGPHPNEYHAWLLTQADAIDAASGGDALTFLALWDVLVRDVIASDPTIVRNAYWDC